MRYALNIREHNKQAHLDIEEDIKNKQNGLITFTIRVNNGNIVDYNLMDYVNAREKYLSLRKVTIEELTVSHYPRSGSAAVAVQPDNLQRRDYQRDSGLNKPEHSQEQKEKVRT